MGRPKVYLRLRPPIFNNEINDLLFGEINENNTEITYTKQSEKIISRKTKTTIRFDKIFSEDSTQEDIFNNLNNDIINNIINGYTIGLIMYGATGSGKTYSLEGKLGDTIEQGLFPRIVESTINEISKLSKEFSLKLSCIQIYNGKIEDMLGQDKNLNKSSNTLINAAKNVKDSNFVSIMRMYSSAAEKRHVGTNVFHSQSSRSHAITQLTFYWTPKDSNVEKVSNIIFVDLAGSEENLDVNNNDPTNQKNINAIARNQEGKFIKQGLLHFKNVLRDIVASNKKGGKRTVLNCGNTLTQVLDHLLSGESIINVLLCISNRMSYSIDNTKTLGTGTDILQLPIAPKVNKIKQEMALIDTITEQQEHIADLKHELEKARETAMEAEFTKQTEKLNQISQKTEIIELQSQLNELRNQFIGKDEEIKSLNEINCDLEIAKEKLIKLLTNNRNNNSNDTNNNNNQQQQQIKKLEDEIKSKENSLKEINKLEQELQEKLELIIEKQKIRDRLSQNIQQLEETIPRTDEIKINLSNSKISLQENENIINILNNEIKKIFKRKQDLENEVTRLKSRVDAHLDAEKNYKNTLEKLRTLDNEMKLLTETIKQIPHTTPPSTQLIELELYKTNLEHEINSIREEVKKNENILTTTTLNLDIALKSLPENLRVKAENAIRVYEQQQEERSVLKQQEQAILNELKNLDVDIDNDNDVDNDNEDHNNNNSNGNSNGNGDSEFDKNELGRNLAQDLIRLREIEQNDELKSLIQKLPYNIDKVILFLSFHPSCKERFFELGGLTAVLNYLPLVIHVSTFAKLCELLGNCLFDDNRIYDTIKSTKIFETIENWFEKSEWIDYPQGIHILTLDAISALCTTKKFQNELKSCVNILRVVIHFVINSEIQSIIHSACRCLALLSPSDITLKQLKVGNFTTFISNICISLINHLSNPSILCRKEASFCISKLYVESIFKITFENHQILKYVINAILSQKSIDSTASQAYSVLLLTLIESNNSILESNNNNNNNNNGNNNGNNNNNVNNTETIKKLAYESLALGFVTRVSTDDTESIRINGVSPELPYTAEVVRGEWNITSSGGPISHSFFFDNPMYTLTIPLSDNNNNNNTINSDEILVTFALKKMPSRHPSEQDIEIINSRRTSYANLRIAPLSSILQDIQLNVSDPITLKELVIEELKNGKIPINSKCFKYFYETSYPTDNVYTFSLLRGETYIIIPQSEVRGIHEYYIMAIVANTNFILQEQRETMKKQLFNGLFPLPDSISKKYEGYKHPSWRNFPQILIEPNITKPEMLIAMVSYLDCDNSFDELHLYHDEILQSNDLREKYSKRPKFTMKIFDVTNTSKRVVYSANYNVQSVSYWMSSTWTLLYSLLLPGNSYIISIGLVGEYNEIQKLPFRLQLFTTQCDLNITPLTREHEWYSFNEVYRLSTNPLKISLTPLSTLNPNLLLKNIHNENNPDTTTLSTTTTTTTTTTVSKLSGYSLILIFRLHATQPRKFTFKLSQDPNFTSHSFSNISMNVNEEQLIPLNEWFKNNENLENIYISFEYQTDSLPNNNEVDFLSILGFTPIPFNTSEGGLQLGWINNELDNNNNNNNNSGDNNEINDKKIFLNTININYQSPLNWDEICWKEPLHINKSIENITTKRKVLVDVTFLQDIYSQMNKFLSIESKPIQKEWETLTLNQLSQVIDPTKVSRYTIKMKKLSAKDIRDIFLEIQSSNTQFGINLFTNEEINQCCGSKSGGSNSGRISFIQKLILYIEILLNQNIYPSIEPSHVSAGTRPEDSARLVRKLCDAALTSKHTWETGVQLVHEKLNNSTQYLNGNQANVIRALTPRSGQRT